MKRTFIEFPAFSRSVASGRIGDRRLRTLEQEIMEGGGVTILIVAFEKTVKEDLTRAEANELKRLKGELDRLMGV